MAQRVRSTGKANYENLKAKVVWNSRLRMNKNTKQALEKTNFIGDVCITTEIWRKFNLHDILKSISQWKIPEGLLIQCQQPYILNSLSNIKFTSLKKLSLRGNKIQSVESLPLFSMPNLEKLFLSNNRIINLNSLRRINIPCLSHIQIDQNFIKQIDLITELKAPNLRKINLDRPDKYLGINWIFKFQCKLSNIQISSFKRIQQPWLIQKLKDKFQNVNVIKKW